jgi:hypothetical protein
VRLFISFPSGLKPVQFPEFSAGDPQPAQAAP